MDYDRAALKNEVKEDMRRIRPRPLLATLIFLLVGAALGGLVQWLQGLMSAGAGQDITALVGLMQMAEYGLVSEEQLMEATLEMSESLGPAIGVSMFFGLISAVINWTIRFGYQGFCLDMIRQRDPGYGRLACAIPQWGWVLLTGLLVGLFTFLWGLLMAVGAMAATFLIALVFGDSFLGAVMMFAVWAAVVAGMVAISLRYSMANYILLDERVDALEAISRSKDMMRGRKWHLFVLELSFIGWYLLEALIVCVVVVVGFIAVGGSWMMADSYAQIVGAMMGLMGVVVVAYLLSIPLMLWLQPYVTGATAKFYDWSRQADQNSGVWEGRYDDHTPVRPQYEAPQPPVPPEEPRQPEPEPEPEPPANAPDRPNYE